jgi:hypothetical protein
LAAGARVPVATRSGGDFVLALKNAIASMAGLA